MDHTELEKNVIYRYEDDNYIWINRFKYADEHTIFTEGDMCIKKTGGIYFYPAEEGSTSPFCDICSIADYDVTFPSDEELAHYEACVAARKLVAIEEVDISPKIKDNYEIF